MHVSMQATSREDSVKIIRPVNSAYMLSGGSSSLLDTYLSHVTYDGINLRLGYERLQCMKFNPERWTMQMEFGVAYDNVQNIVRNRTMHSLNIDFSWGMMHRWNLAPNLIIYGGGSAGFNGGVTYNQYNSNNPVSVNLRLSLAMTGMVAYNLKLGKLPVTLRYQATLPFIGMFFSTDYGESYYEIYVGNSSGLVHCGWWGNRFDMVNMLTADLHFGNTSLRLGYRGTIECSNVCNLDKRIFTNCAVIGVSGEWMSVNPREGLDEKTRMITALY